MKKTLLYCASLALLCSCKSAPNNNEMASKPTTDTAVTSADSVEKPVAKENPQKALFDLEALKSEWKKAFNCNADCCPKEYVILDLNGDDTKELLCRDKETGRLAIFRMADKLELYACNYLQLTDCEISFLLYKDAVVTSGGVSACAVETVVPFTNGAITKYREILGGMSAKNEMEVDGVKKDFPEADYEKERAKYKDAITNLDGFNWVKF